MIPANHLLYPTPERVAEAHELLWRESTTGEYLHPAVKANCEQVLRFDEEINGRKMTPAEIEEWRRTCPYPEALGPAEANWCCGNYSPTPCHGCD